MALLNTWRWRVGVRAGQPEDIMDIGGEEAVTAMHVLARVEVLVKSIHYGRHDFEGSLAQID